MKYIKKYLIYSQTSKTSHIISKCDDGSYACDCIGWIRHYPRINCKHIIEVIRTNPEPLDMVNWDKLKMKKEKIKKVLDIFRKTPSPFNLNNS